MFIARHYWPKPGAATVRLQALVRAWIDRGDDVTVVTVRSDALQSCVVGPHGESIVPIIGDKETGVGLSRIARLLWFGLAAMRAARRLHPQVVIADPPPTSGLAALGAGASTSVYYIADSWAEMLEEGGGRLSRILAALVRPMERLVLRRVSIVIAVRDNLRELANRAGARQVTVARYGTDLSVFRIDGPRWEDPWHGKRPYFVYAGNYGVIQGATVFLDGAELLWQDGHKFGMVYMGYGSDAAAVEQTSERYPEEFKSLPPMPPEIAAAAYRGATGALASMRPVDVARETRPAKALAAVACGCPLIFAGTGSFVREIDAEGLGHAVVWDAKAVSEAMLELLRERDEDPKRYGEGRLAAAQYAAANYDMRPAADSLVALIVSQAV